MPKILTVFGATGSQGGSVVRAVRAHPILSGIYRIRGVTRSLTSEQSKNLTAEGVDMVQVWLATAKKWKMANFLDKADLNEADSVYQAVLGSDAVFAMTNCAI
jgi:uncharacterized protein YbjT (DUF2867 family)